MTQAEFNAQHYNAHPKCIDCKWCEDKKHVTHSQWVKYCTVKTTGDEFIGNENSARKHYCCEWKDANNTEATDEN